MANVSIYSNVNTATKTITVDFVGNILAASDESPIGVNAASTEYYFRRLDCRKGQLRRNRYLGTR